MENGIPNYLKPYFAVTKTSNNFNKEFSVTGNTKCTCGCEKFTIVREKWIQSSESKEAEKKIESLYEKHRKSFLQKNGTLCETGTEDGKWCIAYITYEGGEKRKVLEDITELRKIANSTPLVPTIFEATCSHCGENIDIQFEFA